MARIIAVANQKGGVGKTTNCVNLAASLALSSSRVLLVDLDAQGNATMGCGVDKHTVGATVYEWLVEDRPLAALGPAVQEAGAERTVLAAARDRQRDERSALLLFQLAREVLGLAGPGRVEDRRQAVRVERVVAVRQERKQGVEPRVDIMLPLTSSASEVTILRERLEPIAAEDARQVIGIGAMIETPRACLRAEEIARGCDFFSFGTNDLTQLAFGLSRDDAGTFMPEYRNLGLLAYNPFRVLDDQGVGELLAIAVERGRITRQDMPMALCGEQGAEPESVRLAHDLGFNSVSCSPYRVPIARLAAAQAALVGGR